MCNLTPLEFRYLDAIVNSPYQDDKAEEFVVDNPIWSFCPNDRLQIGRRAAGVAASLVKKGFATADEYERGHPTIAITALGWREYNRHHACDACDSVTVARTVCFTVNGADINVCNACADTADSEGWLPT